MDKFTSLLSPGGIRAALIDMDGTLYDSMPSHAAAWMLLMDDMGVDARPEEFYFHEGCTGAWMINHMMQRQYGREATEAEKKDFYARKSAYFAEMPPVPLMPGAQKLVSALQDMGVTTVLVTGSGQGSLFERLERDFPGAFPPERRVTSHSVARGKPAPDPFLKGLELAGVEPSQAIAVDNAPLGVRSGHTAGIPTVGVVTGPLKAGDLTQAGADIVFNSMSECADLLPRLLYSHKEL